MWLFNDHDRIQLVPANDNLRIQRIPPSRTTGRLALHCMRLSKSTSRQKKNLSTIIFQCIFIVMQFSLMMRLCPNICNGVGALYPLALHGRLQLGLLFRRNTTSVKRPDFDIFHNSMGLWSRGMILPSHGSPIRLNWEWSGVQFPVSPLSFCLPESNS